MKKNIFSLIALLAAGLFYTVYADSGIPISKNSQAVLPEYHNFPAPDFSFEDISGIKHSLSDFSRKAIVLNFWASWCAPCIIEFPEMLNAAAKNKTDTVFIFLSLDTDVADIKKFLSKFQTAMKSPNVYIGLDKDKNVSQNLYKTYKLPETYLLEPGLQIKEKIIGYQEPWDSAVMQEKIDNLSL